MKIFTGKVISNKMQKTITVAVERTIVHPMYKKRIKRTRKYHVHDDLGVEVGQQVKFAASKPISKLKKWKVIEVVDKLTKTKVDKQKANIIERRAKRG